MLCASSVPRCLDKMGQSIPCSQSTILLVSPFKTSNIPIHRIQILHTVIYKCYILKLQNWPNAIKVTIFQVLEPVCLIKFCFPRISKFQINFLLHRLHSIRPSIGFQIPSEPISLITESGFLYKEQKKNQPTNCFRNFCLVVKVS